jgi:hypothetical protein
MDLWCLYRVWTTTKVCVWYIMKTLRILCIGTGEGRANCTDVSKRERASLGQRSVHNPVFDINILGEHPGVYYGIWGKVSTDIRSKSGLNKGFCDFVKDFKGLIVDSNTDGSVVSVDSRCFSFNGSYTTWICSGFCTNEAWDMTKEISGWSYSPINDATHPHNGMWCAVRKEVVKVGGASKRQRLDGGSASDERSQSQTNKWSDDHSQVSMSCPTCGAPLRPGASMLDNDVPERDDHKGIPWAHAPKEECQTLKQPPPLTFQIFAEKERHGWMDKILTHLGASEDVPCTIILSTCGQYGRDFAENEVVSLITERGRRKVTIGFEEIDDVDL